jgi:hypothetical protein
MAGIRRFVLAAWGLVWTVLLGGFLETLFARRSTARRGFR